jgi:hypothetical protein
VHISRNVTANTRSSAVQIPYITCQALSSTYLSFHEFYFLMLRYVYLLKKSVNENSFLNFSCKNFKVIYRVHFSRLGQF